MTDQHNDDADLFANVTSPDVRPGETAAEARGRRRAERARATRKANADPKPPTKAAAPKADAPPKAAPRRGPGRPSNLEKRTAALTSSLGIVAAGVGLFHEADAEAIAAGSPELAAAVARMAETNPRVARWIDALSSGGASLDVIMAATPIILAIAANHNLFAIGGPPPEAPATPPATGYVAAPEDIAHDDPAAPWMKPFTAQ